MLDKLKNIQINQNWKVTNSSIECIPKVKGKLKNFIEFTAVIKTVTNQILKKNYEEDLLKIGFENISKRYTSLKMAIQKKPLITRLFLKIVLI